MIPHVAIGIVLAGALLLFLTPTRAFGLAALIADGKLTIQDALP